MSEFFDWIDYAEFGERFIRRAVTEERVSTALSKLDGKSMRVGPIKADPLGMAEASAEGSIGTPTVRRRDGAPVSFDVTIPISLGMRLKFGHEGRSQADIRIDLALTPKPAAPLLIVIDIPPVGADDVRLELRADGLAGAFLPFVEVLEREIRAQVAKQVNVVLNEPRQLASRVIDIAAKIDGRQDSAAPARPEFVGYAEFGEAFFRLAVTEKRLAGGLNGLAGREITIGPLRAGPKDKATVTAHGTVDVPSIAPTTDALVRFDVTVPVNLDLAITLSRDIRYRCAIAIELALVAKAADPLLIVIDIPRIEADAVRVSLTSRGVVGKMLKAVGGLDRQIAQQVADRVNLETADPAAGGRVVDVGARIDAS